MEKILPTPMHGVRALEHEVRVLEMERSFKLGVHNIFAIAGRITFIFMSYRRQCVQDIFCIASVLLPHTEPSLLAYVCLAVVLLSTLMQ